MRSPFEHSVEAAICRGIDFLLQQQDKDGFWREFDLQPGASESWTTAWVGWCLTRAFARGRTRQFQIHESCKRAAVTLWRSRHEDGWGYNRGTGPDADTTSWVLRFLSACGFRVEPTMYLAPHVDTGGGVHTFLEPGFGSWTDAHDDVAANAGLALLTTSASPLLVARVKHRLARRFPGETFWWSTPTYGAAWTLRFLRASGGISHHIRKAAQNWIADLPESDSSFEVAHRLVAVVETEASNCAAVGLVNQLLDLAGPHGWPGSSLLLVPPRDSGPQSAPNPELRGLMTTAICVWTLSEWIGSEQLNQDQRGYRVSH
jgi:hypothetical protein